jgi:lysophospholipase L1-like esterase
MLRFMVIISPKLTLLLKSLLKRLWDPTTTCADAVKFSSAGDAVEYVAIGDSITKGSGDDIPSDGTGYEPVLESLLANSMIRPVAVTNRGVSGVKASYGAQQISAILSDHPVAQFFLIQYGTNDSAAGDPVPSGQGLQPGDSGFVSSYKGYMQAIISSVITAGRTPFLAKVPFHTSSLHNLERVREYNLVIDELVIENGISAAPPDFYAWFHDHPDQLADELHPDGNGYRSMADLWFDTLK